MQRVELPESENFEVIQLDEAMTSDAFLHHSVAWLQRAQDGR